MVAPCLARRFLDKAQDEAEGKDEVLWAPAPFLPDCMTDRSKVTLPLSASQDVTELLSLLSFSVTYSERMNRAQLSSEIYSLLVPVTCLSTGILFNDGCAEYSTPFVEERTEGVFFLFLS